MGRKYEFIACPNRQGKNCGKSFFCFPRDNYRCSQWVTFCQWQQLSLEFNIGGESGVRKRVLCSDHFDCNQFRNAGVPERGLHGNAVPTHPIGPFKSFFTMEPQSDHYQEADPEFKDVEYLDNQSQTLNTKIFKIFILHSLQREEKVRRPKINLHW